MTDELTPVRCGCGGEAIAYIQSMDGGFWHLINVSCSKCGISTPKYDTEAEAIEAWNRAMGSAEKSSTVERKWHINFDPYDESTSPKEKGYYRIIEEDGTEKTDYFFGEPRMTGHGIGYWATSEKTIIAWTRLEWNE